MFGALEPSNFISQNTVINDRMTSIDQKIVYETLSTGIFFYCCHAYASVSLKWASKAAVLICIGTKIFNFYPRASWFFLSQWRRFFTTSPCTPIAFIYRTPINGLLGCMKFDEVSWNPQFNVSVMNFSFMLHCHKAFWRSLKEIKAACDNCLYLFFLLYTECVIRYYKRRNEQNCGGNVNGTLRSRWKFLLVAQRCFITILLPFEQGFTFLYKKQNSLLHIKITCVWHEQSK